MAVGGPSTAEEGYDEDTYGPAAPIVWTKPVKAVVFSHKTHTMDAGLECDSCHDAIFEMAAGSAQEKDDFTMESLYQGKYCGACHDGSTAFASNTRCTTCHIGVQGHNRLMGVPAGQGGHGGGH
ncbi:MAG: cytochrome c3 family protein [Desulfobulbaceae bacterium]|nr:cytochrome c3 family protein [Desulfobulbaceae bacterium]